MNPRTDSIPGLRRPTPQEMAHIRDCWGPELKRRYSPGAGKLLRYLGTFLVAVSVVNYTRGTSAVPALILAVILVFFSTLGRKSARQAAARLKAVDAGDYRVAPAVSTKVGSTYSGHNPSGYVHVQLPDGESVKGMFEIPYVCAEPLLKSGTQCVPVLLIQTEGHSQILAIPVVR